MKKIILITGATGFVGSNIVKRLIQEEENEVHVLIRETSDFRRLKSLPEKSIKKHMVDLLDLEPLKRCLSAVNPDFIMHTAAYGGNSNEKDIEKIIRTNVIGTINLLEASKNIDYKLFINTGSSSEYGKKDGPMKENDILEPNSDYGFSKFAATLYCDYFAKKHKKQAITLRLFSPFGPADNKNRLISNSIVNALRNKDLNLTSPDIERDYLFIEDAVDAYLAVMNSNLKLYGEIFNVGSGKRTKIADVIKNILRFTNSKSKINWNAYPLREYDSKAWVADIRKIKKYLNWKPKYNLEQGLEKTVDWFKKEIKTN